MAWLEKFPIESLGVQGLFGVRGGMPTLGNIPTH